MSTKFLGTQFFIDDPDYLLKQLFSLRNRVAENIASVLNENKVYHCKSFIRIASLLQDIYSGCCVPEPVTAFRDVIPEKETPHLPVGREIPYNSDDHDDKYDYRNEDGSHQADTKIYIVFNHDSQFGFNKDDLIRTVYSLTDPVRERDHHFI